jgi:hypothetical protein
MQNEPALSGSPEGVLPPVRSIGRAITERQEAFAELEARREDLRRLGCTKVGSELSTIRILCDGELDRCGYLWSDGRNELRAAGA